MFDFIYFSFKSTNLIIIFIIYKNIILNIFIMNVGIIGLGY